MNAPQTDILISRIIDGTATPEDWAQLDAIASDEPHVLQDLSAAMRQDAELRGFVRDAVAVADDVDIDTDRVIVRVDEDQWTTVPPRVPSEPRRSAFMALVTWTGWTAAAAIAMTWIASMMYGDLPTRNLTIPDASAGENAMASSQLGSPATNGNTDAATVLPAAYDEAISQTLELGKQQNRIIEELPVVMLKQRFHGDGRVEIFYLRRFVERVHVDGMLEFQMDSSGQPRVVPVAPEGQPNEY